MLKLNIGDNVMRIVPPHANMEGYAQYGIVNLITKDTIIITIQSDIERRMEFRKDNGVDINGIGSFIIRSNHG